MEIAEPSVLSGEVESERVIDPGLELLEDKDDLPMSQIQPREAGSGKPASKETAMVPSNLTTGDSEKVDQAAEEGLVKEERVDEKIAFVEGWLEKHFKISEQTSVPRSIVFTLYEEASRTCGFETVNPASFGKVIRTIFPEVKTRRLGTRGNSKYHYFGIWPKDQCEGGEALVLERVEIACSNESGMKQKRGRKSRQTTEAKNEKSRKPRARRYKAVFNLLPNHEGKEERQTLNGSSSHSQHPDKIQGTQTISILAAQQPNYPQTSSNITQYQPLVPDFDEFSRFLHQLCQPIPEKISSTIHPDTMLSFSLHYQGHILHLLRLIATRDFATVEMALSMFWQAAPADIWPCMASEEGLRIINIADDYLYQVAIHILVPDVLEALPLSITQSIRYFAKMFEVWMARLFDASTSLVLLTAKMEAVRRFCQSLRRRTSLNHLAHAVRAILASPEHLGQMLHDFNQVDFTALREQVQWIIPGYELFLAYMEESFRGMLFERAPLAGWVQWLESIVEQTLASLIGAELEEACRELMLRWSFFTSMIMRDLTLRSALSFERKMDENRRAIGLMSYWPAQQDQTLYESAMAGFASMDELFRKSGLLAYANN